MSDDYEQYLLDLGWLQHEAIPPHPRPGHIGENVYAEQWRELMLTHSASDEDLIAPNARLARILDELPTRLTQRHATVCATFITWLGCASGMSFRLTAEKLIASGVLRGGGAWRAAWAVHNSRHGGTNGGWRSIEFMLAPPDHFGKDQLFAIGGETLVRMPEISTNDLECIETLCEWLGVGGVGFVLRCEARIAQLHKFERDTKLAEHRARLAEISKPAQESAK